MLTCRYDSFKQFFKELNKNLVVMQYTQRELHLLLALFSLAFV